MDENSPVYQATPAREFADQNGIENFSQACILPDLNPIEIK